MEWANGAPHSRASPLPHLELGTSGKGWAALQTLLRQSGSWHGVCCGVCLMYRGACIAGKPAPTEKQSTAVPAAKLGQHCGSGLARESAGSVTNKPTDPALSRASPLPHLELGTSGKGWAALQTLLRQSGSCHGVCCGVCLMYRGVCIAGKPAPTEKQSTAVPAVKLGQHCGSGLARECGGSVTNTPTGTPLSRASPLPHLDLIPSGKRGVAVLLPCFCFNHSGRLSGRRALLLTLI